MLKDSILGKGGHGAVQDMIMSDNVKKKMFSSDCIDFVMKKVLLNSRIKYSSSLFNFDTGHL
jgi:hypothetical protein